MDSQVKLPGRTPSELCKLGQATEPLWIFIFFIWNRDPLPTVMGLDWGMQTGDSWPADPCYDLIFLLAQIYIFRNMNWMPLDGMSVLTNDFFFCSMSSCPIYVGELSFEFLTPGFTMGCTPYCHHALSQEADYCQWCVWWVCWWEGGTNPQGCSWVWLHVGQKRPMDLVSESSWLSFEVSWSQIIHPLHPGFNGHTTWGPIWNINQDYRIPMKTGDS